MLNNIVLFENARLIVGDSTAPIKAPPSSLRMGQFARIGKKGQLSLSAGAVRVGLSGRTVMPALVDAHVHMGYGKVLIFSADNYTCENLRDALNGFAYRRRPIFEARQPR